jgi:hypothetical protein
MPADFAANVLRDGDAPLLASDVVDPLDVGGVTVAVSIGDDEMLFLQVLGEVEAAAKKMFPCDRIAEAGAFFRGGALDGGLDLLYFGVVNLSKIDRVPFETRQDDGLDKLRIGWHHTVSALESCPTLRVSVLREFSLFMVFGLLNQSMPRSGPATRRSRRERLGR